MKKANFIQPRLGLETISAKRLEDSGAKTTNKEFLKAIQCLIQSGFLPNEIAVNILIGLPDQGFEEIKEAIEFVGSKGMRIFLEEYSPIPNTTDYLKSGLSIDADPLLHNNSVFPAYASQDYKKFQELKDLAHKLNKENSF